MFSNDKCKFIRVTKKPVFKLKNIDVSEVNFVNYAGIGVFTRVAKRKIYLPD